MAVIDGRQEGSDGVARALGWEWEKAYDKDVKKKKKTGAGRRKNHRIVTEIKTWQIHKQLKGEEFISHNSKAVNFVANVMSLCFLVLVFTLDEAMHRELFHNSSYYAP